MKTRKITQLTMLLAMSILINIIEPAYFISGIPGVKFGVANSIGLIALYIFGQKEMWNVNLLRVVLASILRGIIFGIGFWMSLAGIILSTLFTSIAYKLNKFSPIGISVGSAYFHTIGQIAALIFLTKNIMMIYWLPVPLFVSIIAGYLTGLISNIVIKRFNK